MIFEVKESKLSCFSIPGLISLIFFTAVMIPVDRYLSYWKIAHFPQGGVNSKLSNKTVYSTLVRIHPSGDKAAIGYVNIFKEFGWRRVAMVMSNGACYLPAPAIYAALQVNLVINIELRYSSLIS